MNYLHVELPSLHLVWKRDGQTDVVCSVIRTNYPKPSLLLVPAIMRTSGVAEVRVIDMKIRDQDVIVPYCEFNYGEGKMVASRMGMPFDSIRSQLEWADILGLTINPSSWANLAVDFAGYAKCVNPQIKIIIGGTDATFRPEFYLRHEHFEKRRLFDFVVVGEGEVAGPELLRRLEFGQQVDEIFGVAYYSDGKVIMNGINRNVCLDDEPLPAMDLFVDDMSLWTTPIEGYVGMEVRPPIAPLYITRGCNNACEYCTTPQKYGRLRFKSLSRVEEELKHFKTFGIGTINIWDDSLSSLVGRGERDLLIGYIRLIRQYGFSFEYAQGMVIRDLWNKEKNEPDFALIKELYGHAIVDGQFVGCYGQYTPFEFLQTENPHDLNSKLIPFDKELRVLQAILDQGVRYLSYSCILGRADDSAEQFRLAESRMKQIQGIIEAAGARGLATPYIYSIFPGTRIWSREIERLDYSIEEYPELYQLNAAPHGTTHLTPGELMQAKLDLERESLGEERFKCWIKTGRYQW